MKRKRKPRVAKGLPQSPPLTLDSLRWSDIKRRMKRAEVGRAYEVPVTLTMSGVSTVITGVTYDA